MKKMEQAFTTRFLVWLRQHSSRPTVVEIKHSHGQKSIALTSLKEHQRNALLAAKRGKFTYKIPDTGFYNPFDAVLFTGMDAYLVIAYPSCFVLIDIDDVPLAGSLTEEEAKQKAAHVGRL